MSRGGLEAENLIVRFGGLVAVEGVSLDAPSGRITGLIGPNGAGKTTTFNACSGLVPCEGKIRLEGQDVTETSPARRARQGLGRTFQKMELFDRLTVFENVSLAHEATLTYRRLGGQIWSTREERGRTRRAAGSAVELCGLGEVSQCQAGSLPTGQRRLLELAMTLVGPFTVLMLDEPSSGLDSGETDQFGKILQQIVDERGLAILLVEHDMALVNRVCEYLFVLDFGRPLIDGPTDQVLASEAVAAAYLGSEAVEGVAGKEPAVHV
jgi:ABC-type branched-subunit amino acid transport system ATPase component